jgi:GWxTD domain-containing protein
MWFRAVFAYGLLALVALVGCAYHPENRRTVVAGDFLEGASAETTGELRDGIDSLRSAIELDPRNAELHRRLAVLYRRQGTPRSRLLSMEEIERAIALDPMNAELHVEKGLTLVAQRMVGDAQQSFLHATELDKLCFDAWFQLGRMEQYEYYKTMCFPDHLIKAIDYFERAFRLNRKHEDVLINLGFLYSFRQMYNTGYSYARRALIYYPKSSRAHLLAGMLHTELKQFEEAERDFAAAFLLMSDEERQPYDSIAYLLEPDERELYLSSMPDKRKDWNRRFWIENDPTPATDVNERQLEHFRRVVIADWTLSDERLGLRGTQTDRGGALIKYGPPDKKYYDLGTGTSGAWVVWEYRLGGGAFRLYYFDEFLNGNYHYPITDYFGEMSINTVDRIPQQYQYPVSYARLPMNVEIAELRGSDDRTKLEFAIALPDTIKRMKGKQWDLMVTFFDADWNRYSRDRFSFFPDSLRMIERMHGRYVVLDLAIEMLPRALRSTCIVEALSEADKCKGTRRYPLSVRDMYGRSLKLSSIKFTLPRPDGNCSSVLDPIPSYPIKSTVCLMYEIYNLRLNENNLAHYRLTYSIRNPEKTDEESPASLQKTLSYMWSSIKGGKSEERPYITSAVEQSANATTVGDNLEIDLGSLEKGTYLLVLEVEDLTTGMKTAESGIFNVTD